MFAVDNGLSVATSKKKIVTDLSSKTHLSATFELSAIYIFQKLWTVKNQHHQNPVINQVSSKVGARQHGADGSKSD